MSWIIEDTPTGKIYSGESSNGHEFVSKVEEMAFERFTGIEAAITQARTIQREEPGYKGHLEVYNEYDDPDDKIPVDPNIPY